MNRRNLLAGLGVVALAGCSRASSEAGTGTSTGVVAAAMSGELPSMQVFKNVGCGCCDLWVDHLRAAGFTAEVQEISDMGPIKERVGVPVAMGSCHTAEVGGYFVEGHVPATDIIRLLKERPAAKGLTVPGMPLGSPGMEVEGQSQPYDVFLVANDGTTSVFAHHGPAVDSGADSGV